MDAGRAMGLFKRMFRKVLRMTYRGFKYIFGDALSNPKKFFALITFLIIIIILTYWKTLVLFLVPLAMFYIALWVGRGTYEKKKKRRLGLMGTMVIMLITVLVVTPTVLGYIIYENSQMVTARLPVQYTDAGSGNGWAAVDLMDLTYPDETSALFVNYDSKEYQYDGGETPPYTGILIVITVKSVPLTTSFPDSGMDEIEARLEDYILDLDAADFEGLSLDRNSKVTGTRTIKDGHDTRWFEYTGKIDKTPSNALIGNFVSGGKIKLRGETWACTETGTIISAAGSAQYGYTFEPGTFKYGYAYAQRDYPDDLRTWVTLKNLISNVKCT